MFSSIPDEFVLYYPSKIPSYPKSPLVPKPIPEAFNT